MRNLCILILVLTFYSATGQKDYVAMGEVTSWQYRVTGFLGSNEFWLNANGDTIINGLPYRIITNLEDPLFDYFIREDTTERKVYHYNQFTSEEVLLYDFGLDVGDLFISERYDNFPIEVIEKEIVSSSGYALYRWKLSFDGLFSFTYTEAIGADFLLLDPRISDPVYNLNCAYNQCQKIFGDENCTSYFADQTEIPYNGIDEDCNPNTLDDDLDQDGFLAVDDCDDSNPDINPDQTEIPYNNIDEDCNPNTLDDDLDQDGFSAADDCDDNNPDINPNQTEIPYNGIDEDCNPNTLDDDLDQDGFSAADDCDDNNPNINPDQTEIPYNGIDEDCNPDTLDDDLDQDGFLAADDCDDNNPDINPDQTEIPYNNIDEDCNPNTLDDDLDQDGFSAADDCVDNNPDINPDQTEIPYNGIDEDCNPNTLDDDLDQDGFFAADDCDDNNPDINPSAMETPNNGIDEDCDGSDLTTSTYAIEGTSIYIYPNPVSDQLHIEMDMPLDYQVNLFTSVGRLILSESNPQQLQLGSIPSGIYLLEIKARPSEEKFVSRIIIK